MEQLETNVAALDNLAFTDEELAEIDQHAVDAGINIWAESSSLREAAARSSQQFMPSSPLVRHLGMRLESIGDRRGDARRSRSGRSWRRWTTSSTAARSRPDRHRRDGGRWADDAEPESLAGSTVTLNVNYVAAARGQDLTAHAVVVRKRGRSLVFSEVRVTEPDGRLVATGSVGAALGLAMTEAEARELAGSRRELSALPRGIGDVHGAIAGRVFGALGPSAAPVRSVHDTISRGVYASVSGGLRVATGAAPARGDVPLSETPRGAMASRRSTGCSATGCAAEGSPLAIPMQRARDGPAAPPHVVVFVHGLGETEYAWGSPTTATLHEARHHAGLRPLQHRPPHLRERRLARGAARRAVATGRSERITLSATRWAGSSRAAPATTAARGPRTCATRSRSARRTRARRSSRPCTRMSAALHLAPETRPFARFLRRRSAGIRDLRRGSLVDEDWRDQDPDALRAKACRGPAARRRDALLRRRHDHAQRKHPVGRLLGDTLVLSPSASGRRIGFARHGLALGGTHHLALLNHPEVYAQLERAETLGERLCVVDHRLTSCPYSHSLTLGGCL